MSPNSPSAFAIPVIGLTGGVASGKSTVAGIIQNKFGIPVIDADQLARELSSPGGKAAPEILAKLGTLDRAELRKKVFADVQARQALEGILHPLIAQASRERVAELAAQGATRVIYEAALLVETGRYKELAGLIVVAAPLQTRIQRLMSRDGRDGRDGRDRMTREAAQQIIAAQASDEARAQVADLLINNSGSLPDLEEQLNAQIERIRQWQKRP